MLTRVQVLHCIYIKTTELRKCYTRLVSLTAIQSGLHCIALINTHKNKVFMSVNKNFSLKNILYYYINLMIDIVVGLQYGDEGKGKVVNYLASEHNYDYCIRYNGGANAGHTIYKNGTKIVTHQIPTGIVYGIPCIIGDNCYLDIERLQREIYELNNIGIDIKNKLFISSKCNVITIMHKIIDSKDKVIGTTKSGIGPCAVDKYNRCGTHVSKELLEKSNLFLPIVNIDELMINFMQANKKSPNILIEGAQGYGLDINHGDYPYVTSSHCISTDCFNIGIPIYQYMTKMDIPCNIYGVAKIYETYVGSKKFQPDNNSTLEKIQFLGNEYGATTARKRQCNLLNLSYLIKSIWVNQVDKVIINKCDIITDESLDNKGLSLYHNKNKIDFNTFTEMKKYITNELTSNIFWLKEDNIRWSYSPNTI